MSAETLTVDVPWRAGLWLWLPAAAAGGGVLLLAGMVRSRLVFPWAAPLATEATSMVAAGAVMAAVFVAGVRRLRRSAGRAVLERERVTLWKPGLDGGGESGRSLEPTTLAWAEVRGYRDGAAGHVELVPRAPTLGDLSIPTPTEADRTAVLAFLDARGLPRLDG